MRLVAPVAFLLALPVVSAAQVRYLGSGDYTETYVTPRHGIAWQGDFSRVGQRKLNKSLALLASLGAPESAQSDLISYHAANVSEWIDAGYDAALQKFTDCGGTLSNKARSVSP